MMNDHEMTNSYQVVMPRLGLTMRDGKILEWLKQEGEFVQKGEALFTIENEKASLEIESPADGILQILIPVNVTVPILTPVGVLTGSSVKSGHHQAEIKPQNLSEEEVKKTEEVHSNLTDLIRNNIIASPKARAAAKKAGLDLSNVTGSGLRGMVVFSDLHTILEKQSVRMTPLARRKAAEEGINLEGIVGSGPRGIIRSNDLEAMVAHRKCCEDKKAPRPLGNLRAIIASRLSQSWMERPQVTLTTEADATLFNVARKQLNMELAASQMKLSINTLLIKLVAQALVEHPYMNVSLLPDGLCQHSQVNIGLAVDTEPGLMVPVIHDAAKLSHTKIQSELNRVLERTLQGKASVDDLTGGTFTITNLGQYEIDAFTPIINPPECAILGFGRIHEKPIGLNGAIVLRSMVTLSLSFDHRLVDGAPAARFLQRIKQYIEEPFLWTLWQNGFIE